MKLDDQRAVWNKLRDDQKFQLFVEMTDELNASELVYMTSDDSDMYWSLTGDTFTNTIPVYKVSP